VKITITLDTSNAAFEEDPAAEISRILEALSRSFRAEKRPTDLDGEKLRDINGNTVGQVTVSEDQ
jgi:hypothetical protein